MAIAILLFLLIFITACATTGMAHLSFMFFTVCPLVLFGIMLSIAKDI